MIPNNQLPYRKGVGIMLINSNNKIFVGRRIDNNKAWQMPQGGVDDSENLETAAKRELKEETGIVSIKILKQSKKEFIYDLPEELIGKIWSGKFKGQIQTWFLIQFIGKDNEINLKQKRAEFCEWKWVNINELHEMIVPFKKKLYKDIIEEFKNILRLNYS